jgi:hypothetical protein
MNIQFDNQAIKNLNEICKCNLVEGVELRGDEVGELEDFRADQDINLTRASMVFKRGGTLGSSLNVKTNKMSMDEENDLLDDVSLLGVAESSPYMQRKKGNPDQFKRASTYAVKEPH